MEISLRTLFGYPLIFSLLYNNYTSRCYHKNKFNSIQPRYGCFEILAFFTHTSGLKGTNLGAQMGQLGLVWGKVGLIWANLGLRWANSRL